MLAPTTIEERRPTDPIVTATPSPVSPPVERTPMPMPMPMPDMEDASDGVAAPMVRNPAEERTPMMSPMERTPSGTANGKPTNSGLAGDTMSRTSPSLALSGSDDEPIGNMSPDELLDHRGQRAVPGSPAALRTSRDLIEVLSRPEPPDEAIVLEDGAIFELPSQALSSTGRWRLRASASSRVRPRISFRPDGNEATGWRALLRLSRSGKLELQDVDIILQSPEAPMGGRWAAFALGSGAELNLVRCTVTVEPGAERSALIAVESSDAEPAGTFADPLAITSIRIKDCVLRGNEDIVDVGAGRRLDPLRIENSIIGSGGALIHGHGLPRGRAVEPIKLDMDRCVTRTAGGLIQLDTVPGRARVAPCRSPGTRLDPGDEPGGRSPAPR